MDGQPLHQIPDSARLDLRARGRREQTARDFDARFAAASAPGSTANAISLIELGADEPHVCLGEPPAIVIDLIGSRVLRKQ